MTTWFLILTFWIILLSPQARRAVTVSSDSSNDFSIDNVYEMPCPVSQHRHQYRKVAAHSIVGQNVKVGEQRLETLRGKADKETFFDIMFGVDCYTRALGELTGECKDLGADEKSRLALMLMQCQLMVQGEVSALGGLSFFCHKGISLQECMKRLTDRDYIMYVEFLTHVDSMCLFIQNQEFEKYTEAMLAMLAERSDQTLSELSKLKTDLKKLRSHDIQQIKNLTVHSKRAMEGQMKLQIEILDMIEKQKGTLEDQYGIMEVYRQQQDQMARKHAEMWLQFVQSHNNMQDVLNVISDQIDSIFMKLRRETQMLMLEQHETHLAQREIKKDMDKIQQRVVNGSQNIMIAIKSLSGYQEMTNNAINKILGGKFGLHDALFYSCGLALLILLSIVGVDSYSRLYICLGLISCLVLERFTVNVYMAVASSMYPIVSSVSSMGISLLLPRWLLERLPSIKALIRYIFISLGVYYFVKRFWGSIYERPRESSRVEVQKLQAIRRCGHLSPNFALPPPRPAFSDTARLSDIGYDFDQEKEEASSRSKERRTARIRKQSYHKLSGPFEKAEQNLRKSQRGNK